MFGRHSSLRSLSEGEWENSLVRTALENYQYQQLLERRVKLSTKLTQVDELIKLHPFSKSTSLCKLSRLSVPSPSWSAASPRVHSLYECDQAGSTTSLPSLCHSSTSSLEEINEQDARMREKRIIDFERMKQQQDETIEQYLTRLQYNVVAAYGKETTETLQRRVAWAFIRGLREHSVRTFIVAEGWTKSDTETLSPVELLELSHKSPVVQCEGVMKRKIVHSPHDVKVDSKSWCTFYVALKANTIFFFKDFKHYKKNEIESGCDISGDTVLDIEEDKKRGKLIKISKSNGLEMLLRAGDKPPTFEDWLESFNWVTKTFITSKIHSQSVTDTDNNNGLDTDCMSPVGVDGRSVIDSKEITKKTINNFLNNRPDKSSGKIRTLLTSQGIDISHLDKEKKKRVLNMLLSKRPAYQELLKKGLIKFTVFGCPLSTLCSRLHVTVPPVITDCIEAIEYRGIRSNGLYRLSGNSAAIQKLRFKVDREEPVNLKDDEYDINMLTGFLKLFLRELPEPVIPFNVYPTVETAIRLDDEDPDKTLHILHDVIRSLPEPNRSTLVYIILHLVRVSNEKDENQMDEHNLSIIFGPSLLGNHPDSANLLVDLPIQNRSIELIIGNYKTVLR